MYNYTDHLGNIRLSYSRSGIIETNHYYPLGLKHEGYDTFPKSIGGGYQYKYNGKELQTEIGMYDYGARFYMPDVGIFGQHDPLSEKTGTPYAYTYNNPIRYIDPDGRKPIWIVGKDGKKVTYTINSDGSLQWSINASEDTKRIGNSLARTEEGRKRLKDANDSKHGIHFSLR